MFVELARELNVDAKEVDDGRTSPEQFLESLAQLVLPGPHRRPVLSSRTAAATVSAMTKPAAAISPPPLVVAVGGLVTQLAAQCNRTSTANDALAVLFSELLSELAEHADE